MRPPSYYTSLASNNSATSKYNRDSSYSSLPTNSSSALRSSFSNSSTSSYVTRTHLPYVSQSMLVAHCITGGGSTTKPNYGLSSPSSLSRSSSSYLSSLPSSSSRSNSSRSYSSSSAGYSSRAASTKRHHNNPYLSASSTSSSYTPAASRHTSRSYLSTPSALSHSSYRPSPSYNYQPIRLRERPLLTQISRHINTARTPTTTTSTRVHSDSTSQRKLEGEEEESSEKKVQEETSWSSDVARNISRNKYLIKFREFDKRNSISPIQPLDESLAELNFESKSRKFEEPTKVEAEEERMKLPLNETVKSDKLPEKQHQLTVEPKAVQQEQLVKVEPEKICDNVTAEKTQPSELGEKKKAPKEKRNIKLKLKTINASSTKEASATKVPSTETSLTSKVAAKPIKEVAEESVPMKKEKKTPPEDGQQNNSPALKSKVKKLVKKGSTKAAQAIKDPEASENGIAQKSEETQKTPTKVLKHKDQELEAKKVKKSEPKVDERKMLSLTQPISETKVITKDETKKQTKLASSQKVLKLKTEKVDSAKAVEAPKERKEVKLATLAESTQVSAGSNKDKRIRFREYNYDDFNFLSVLGHGGWGFVILAELKDHDACFAVKCIKKITIVEDDDFDSIMIERKMLALGNVHPFICKLFCTFETEGYLFFVMEYCAGGDLMFHVQKEGKFTEPRCRFYAAEIICAIRFLHNRHIIYRDLKLDNILLDSKGHVRLVDFGMCQCRTYREEMLPSNFCGTPEYISPEIIKGVPYNHSVDWWSFGVLLYEMAVGKMPFRGNDENELLWNVCYEQIHYPMFLTKELTSLLKSLLEREPSKRMGMSTCKAGDIYDQPWFRGVDWPAIEGMRVKPPFVPEVTSKRDVQNFDADFTQSAPELSPVDASTLAKIDQNQFHNFPYTNPNIFIFD